MPSNKRVATPNLILLFKKVGFRQENQALKKLAHKKFQARKVQVGLVK
jgi:hypothetical protein